MIKSGPIEDLAQAGFHYITAITKPQIHTLIEARLIQMELFTAEVCEVQQDGVRYVLRRNPIRAAQRAASRADKQTSVEQLRQDLMAISTSILAPNPPPPREPCAPRLRN